MQHILLAYFGEHARRNAAALLHEDHEDFRTTLDAGRKEMVDLFDRSYRAFGKQATEAGRRGSCACLYGEQLFTAATSGGRPALTRRTHCLCCMVVDCPSALCGAGPRGRREGVHRQRAGRWGGGGACRSGDGGARRRGRRWRGEGMRGLPGRGGGPVAWSHHRRRLRDRGDDCRTTELSEQA